MIAVVDYGVGNLASVERALRRAGAAEVRVSADAAVITSARGVVLPGVGHFGHCARALAARGLDAVMREVRARDVPLLGLCVGMQLFFERSEEDESARGLALLPGVVRRLPPRVRVPHTGWNSVSLRRAHPWLARVPDGAHFYFVHSYAPEPAGAVGVTEHGAPFGAVVGSGTLMGVQFHPEKSSHMGTRLLSGFVAAAA